jgi:murein L,D-transpeptidase YafK
MAQAMARAENPGAETWILVDSQSRTLSVYRSDRLVERFQNVAFGRGGLAEDRVRGDGTTPIGTFHIDRIKRSSRFHLFFGIDYPRPEQAERALEAGRIDSLDYWRIVVASRQHRSPPQDTALGGHLGIHGLGDGDRRIHEGFDWTQGCIALTNAQITRLSHWIFQGMRIEVR